MLIFMTGATGFIGGHLARRLAEAGYKIRTLVRPGSRRQLLDEIGAEILTGDFEDTRLLDDAVAGSDVIINAAGKLGKWGVTREDLHKVNVSMVKRLLEAMQGNSVQQFIHFSTPGVVGMVGIAPECMPPRPSGAYERTKYEAERLVLSYHREGTVPVTILRPDFVYGPGDLHKLRMFKAIRERRFPILGQGASVLHPTYVDDVAEGTMLVLRNPLAYGHTFNIAGPSIVTVRQMVYEIADALGVETKSLPVPSPILKLGALALETAFKVARKEPPVTRQQVRFFTCNHASDISKIQTMLGYQPRVHFNEGVDKTVAWYKQEGYL